MKNYFEVNGVTKNLQWDILYVGYFTTYTNNTTRTNYAISSAQAILLIENKAEFWVVDGSGKQRIWVIDSWWKKYLKTYKDSKRTNNLDNLPSLPVIL